MKRIVVLLVLLLALVPGAAASEDLWTQFDTGAVERAVPSSAGDAVSEISADKASLNGGISGLMSSMQNQAGGLFRQSLSSMLLIIVVLVLCGVANSFLDGSRQDIVTLSGVLGVAAVAVGDVNGVIQTARLALDQINTFALTLLPAMAGATTAMGRPASAVARQAATMFFSSMFLSLLDKVLLPLLLVYLALITVSAVLPKNTLDRLAALVKWLVMGILTVSMTAFVLYLTLSSAISGSADALTMKGAKTVISGMVPVVGGIISDASETLMVGAGIVKNAIGLFGLFAVLGIALTPFLQMGIRTLMFKATGALVAPIAEKSLSRYIDGLSGVFLLALAMTASAAFLLIISIVSFILAGG